MAVLTSQAKALGALGDGWVISGLIGPDDTNATSRVIEIPAKTLVTDVKLLITTALSGGSPSLDVGDTGNDDGWIDTTDVDETTPAVYRGDGGDAIFAGAASGGKYYASADALTVKVAASLAAGAAYVIARMVRMPL